MTRSIGMLALLTLGACAKPAAPIAEATAPGVQCDANAVQSLVGRMATDVTAEAQKRSGARSVRSYRSGDAVTMDFRPDRLNVERDATGKVVKFTCG